MTQRRGYGPGSFHAELVRTLRGETEAAEARYRMLFEAVGDSIFVVDHLARIVDANPAAERLLGRTREELVSSRVHALINASPAEVDALLRRYLDEGVWRGELELRRKNGGLVPVEGHAATLGAARLHVCVMRDIFERRRMDEALHRLNEQLVSSVAEHSALLTDTVARLEDAEERLRGVESVVASARQAERAQIARELHDEIGQVLTGLALTLSTIAHVPADELRRRIAEAQALVTDLAQTVRQISLELRPAVLQEWGLRTALIWYVARYEGLTGVRVDLDAEPPDQLDRPLSLAAYRIVQEALTNVARHSRATSAQVTVQTRASRLWIQVRDEGRGFDAQAELAMPTSNGLCGMRERAAELGGVLTVEAAPGRGTRITAELPLPAATAPALLRVP